MYISVLINGSSFKNTHNNNELTKFKRVAFCKLYFNTYSIREVIYNRMVFLYAWYDKHICNLLWAYWCCRCVSAISTKILSHLAGDCCASSELCRLISPVSILFACYLVLIFTLRIMEQACILGFYTSFNYIPSFTILPSITIFDRTLLLLALV